MVCQVGPLVPKIFFGLNRYMRLVAKNFRCWPSPALNAGMHIILLIQANMHLILSHDHAEAASKGNIHMHKLQSVGILQNNKTDNSYCLSHQ